MLEMCENVTALYIYSTVRKIHAVW